MSALSFKTIRGDGYYIVNVKKNGEVVYISPALNTFDEASAFIRDYKA